MWQGNKDAKAPYYMYNFVFHSGTIFTCTPINFDELKSQTFAPFIYV
jgi:hypothetical protein